MQAARPARRITTELTRKRLIEGAVDILRREGLGAATTGRIAGAAGLKQPTFYVHFEDRDEVFEAAADEIGRRMLEKLQRQHTKFDAKDARRSLAANFRSILGAFLSEPELTRIFLRYRADEYVEVIVSAVLGMLEALLDGRVRDKEAAVEALADVTAMALRTRETLRR